MNVFITGLFAAVSTTAPFTVKSVTANGNACGSAQVTAELTADGSHLTVSAPDLAFEVAAPKKLGRGTCQALVEITHADNLSAEIGAAKLTTSGEGTASVTVYEQGSDGAKTRCAAATTLIVKAAFLLKQPGKLAATSAITLPLKWGDCVKTTHN